MSSFIDSPRIVSARLAVALESSDKAHLLSQLHYWLEKSQHVHGGRRWVWNTYDQWHELLPWIPTRTIRHHMTWLVEKGLVLTGRFNQRKGDRTLWYSIDYAKVEALAETKWQKLTHAKCQELPHDVAEIATSIPKSTTENTAKNTSGGAAEGDMSQFTGLKPNEIVAKIAAKKAEEPSPSKMTATAISAWWQKLCRFHYNDMASLPEPTKMERGQMAHLLKKCGPETVATIRKVVRGWDGFRQTVMLHKGVTTAPTRPHVGFLLVHADVALNWQPTAGAGEEGKKLW